MARGESPVLTGKGNSVKLYRESFAQAFNSEINRRLYAMRVQRGTGNAGELVLSSRKENVDEAFYQQFPDMRPSTSVSGVKVSAAGRRRKFVEPKYSDLGLRAGAKAAAEADLTGRPGAQAARKLT